MNLIYVLFIGLAVVGFGQSSLRTALPATLAFRQHSTVQPVKKLRLHYYRWTRLNPGFQIHRPRRSYCLQQRGR